MYHRYWISWIGGVGLIITFLLARAEAADEGRPNVLFIIADDIGFADYAFRTPGLRTPVLDELRESGILLTNYYVQPSCTPTRSALFTSKYPIRNGMQHLVLGGSENRSLPLEDLTMANEFQRRGYKTHLVGKWHLGHHVWEATPTFRGFDSFYGFYNGISDYYSHMMGDGYDFHFNTVTDKSAAGFYATDLFTRRAREIVADNIDEPLFLVMSMQAPHTPLQVPSEYSALYRPLFSGDEERAVYFGMITSMDNAIGEVISAFKRKGLWNNTVVVYTSDNGGPIQDDYFGMYGGASNFPLRGGKFSLAEGGIRGTAVVAGPRAPPRHNGTYNGLFHVVDWMPTLLALADGISPPTNLPSTIDGLNLWGALTNSSKGREEFLVNIDDFNMEGAHGAIRRGDWKLMVGPPNVDRWYKPQSEERLYNISSPLCKKCTPYSTGYRRTLIEGHHVQLYDVGRDKEEFYDLAGLPENEGIVRELFARLMVYHAAQREIPNKDMIEDPRGIPSKNRGAYEPWNTPSKAAEEVLRNDFRLYEEYMTGHRRRPQGNIARRLQQNINTLTIHTLFLAWLAVGAGLCAFVWRASRRR